MKTPKLLITVSISGGGKSTWINSKRDPRSGYICVDDSLYEVVSPDNIRRDITGNISDQSQNGLVWKLAKERTIEWLELGLNVILDATNLKSKERRDFINGLPECEKLAKVFPIDPEDAWARVKKDINNKVDRSAVPKEIIYKQFQNFIRDIDKLESDGFTVIE